MGRLGHTVHLEVQAELYGAIRSCVAAGVPVGTFTGEAAVPALLDAGVSFVALGTELGLLAAAARGAAGRFRAAAGGHEPGAGATP